MSASSQVQSYQTAMKANPAQQQNSAPIGPGASRRNSTWDKDTTEKRTSQFSPEATQEVTRRESSWTTFKPPMWDDEQRWLVDDRGWGDKGKGALESGPAASPCAGRLDLAIFPSLSPTWSFSHLILSCGFWLFFLISKTISMAPLQLLTPLIHSFPKNDPRPLLPLG